MGGEPLRQRVLDGASRADDLALPQRSDSVTLRVPASLAARCQGQQPSISVSSEKLRNVRMPTIAARSPTLSKGKRSSDG